MMDGQAKPTNLAGRQVLYVLGVIRQQPLARRKLHLGPLQFKRDVAARVRQCCFRSRRAGAGRSEAGETFAMSENRTVSGRGSSKTGQAPSDSVEFALSGVSEVSRRDL